MPSKAKEFDRLKPNHLAQHLDRFPASRKVWIAFSGGRDSTVLLHLCSTLRGRYPQLSFAAIHVNHGLQSAAKAWAIHCQFICDLHEIPLTIQEVKAEHVKGQSPEEAARIARYQAFNELIEEDDLLLMAHHEDDQAETVLLQLLRGAGVEGISGMPQSAPFGAGFLLRPLLRIDSHKIRCYAAEENLSWIEDLSNQDPRYDRNYLRQTIIPLLQQRWPSTSRVLSRTARHAGWAADRLRKEQKNLQEQLAPNGYFDLSAAINLDHQSLCLAIRGWFESLELRMPSEQLIEQIIRELFGAAGDRTPMIQLGDGSQLHRYRDRAYRIPKPSTPTPCIWRDWDKPFQLPGSNGFITMDLIDSNGMERAIWGSSGIEIRYRTGGEKIRIEGRQGHLSLRNLFQEQGVPPWVRSRVPLLYIGGVLASVGGIWTNSEIMQISKLPISPRPRWDPPDGLDPSESLKRVLSQPITVL